MVGNVIKVHATAAHLGLLLVLALLRLREIKRAGLEDAAALVGLGLEFLVEAHGVVLEPADIGAVAQAVDVGGHIPGRVRRGLVPFQQEHVIPAKLGEMVENRAGDWAADDHNGSEMLGHSTFLGIIVS